MTRKNFFMLVMLSAFLLFVTASSAAFADDKTPIWTKLCASCHDGKTAPDAGELRGRYRTVDDFTAAVKAKGAPCMNIVKNDEKIIRKIAAEIGIRNGTK